MNGKYYSFYTPIRGFSLIDGELYVPFGAYIAHTGNTIVEEATEIFALLDGSYTIENSDDPYLAGTIDLFSKDQFNPHASVEYYSATTFYTTWQLTIKGQIFSSPGEPTKDGFIDSGIRYIGVPNSGNTEIDYYIHANDLCKALDVKQRFSYLESDTEIGLNQVLVFE